MQIHPIQIAILITVAAARLTAATLAAPLNPPDLTPATVHPAPDHPPLVLVDDGAAWAEIYLAPDCGRLTRQAVKELVQNIKQSTSTELPIVKQPSAEATTIMIGAAADLPVEGFEIKTAPGKLSIAGHDDAGTAWGVFDFAERCLGVRYYWPGDDGVSVPPAKRLVVNPAHISDAPVFRKREIWPSGGSRVTPAVGPHHLRLRSHDSWPVKLIVHAPHDWQTLYHETRPEIFQLQGDGRRNFTMLCYGHPRTLETYLEQIESQLTEKPANGKAVILRDNAVTVSPADMAVSCKCAHCAKLWDAGGGTYGTASLVMAEFVRQLARAVKPRWPDLVIIYLPYKNYTYAPAGIEFPGNVEVQICGMPGLAQYKDPVINASEQANIDAWVTASGRKIQNWHYDCWPADRTKAAYQYPHTIKAHYQANRDKTVGTFINGVEDHWPRQNFSLYTWMKVLWNPAFDVDAALEEYCRRMFGPAAQTMRELVGMQIDGWENREWSSHKFSPKSVYQESYPRADVVRMEERFDRAIAEAKADPLVTRRLDYLAAPLRAFFAESKQLAEGGGVQTLRSYQVADDPVIDGKLDDRCWGEIEPLAFVRADGEEGSKVQFPTAIKSVWTRDGITFAFRLTEPDIDQLAGKHGPDTHDASLIWWDDNVELFLDVAGERSDYYQLIVNYRGAIFDSHAKDASWTAAGIQVAAGRGDDHWSLEVYLPYSAFSGALPPGTANQWYGNFTRHRVTDRNNREMQRLNTTGSKSSSDQNAFGPIRFIER